MGEFKQEDGSEAQFAFQGDQDDTSGHQAGFSDFSDFSDDGDGADNTDKANFQFSDDSDSQ